MKTKIKIQYKNMSIYIYELGIFLLLFSTIIRKSFLGEYTGWMFIFTYISWFCMLYRLFCIRNSRRSFILQVILIILAGAVFVSTESLTVATFLLKVFSSENIDEKRTMKVALIAFSLGFMTVIICSLTKKIPISYGIRGAYIFGFRNVNTLVSSISMILIMYLYLYYDSLKNRKIVFFMLLNTGIFLLYRSKTSCLGIYVILIVAFYLINMPRKKNCIKLITWITFICSILLLIGVIIYNSNPFLSKINNLMTGRLVQAHYYYLKYPPTLFGNVIPELNRRGWRWLLDMGFVGMIELAGILFGGFFVYSIFGSLFQRIEQEDYPASLFLLYVALHLIAESYFVDMNISMAPVFFAPFLLKKKVSNVTIENNVIDEQRLYSNTKYRR